MTDAWIQQPVTYRVLPNGSYEVTKFWKLLLNRWALLQYAHTMGGAVITGAFVMCAVGAYYLLEDQFSKYGRVFVRVGVIAGVIATTDWLLAWSGGLSVSCWQSAISYSSIACFAARLPQQRKRMEIKGQQSRFDPSGVKLL